MTSGTIITTNDTQRMESRQESINEEENDQEEKDFSTLTKYSDGEVSPGVHSIIQDFENRQTNEDIVKKSTVRTSLHKKTAS